MCIGSAFGREGAQFTKMAACKVVALAVFAIVAQVTTGCSKAKGPALKASRTSMPRSDNAYLHGGNRNNHKNTVNREIAQKYQTQCSDLARMLEYKEGQTVTWEGNYIDRTFRFDGKKWDQPCEKLLAHLNELACKDITSRFQNGHSQKDFRDYPKLVKHLETLEKLLKLMDERNTGLFKVEGNYIARGAFGLHSAETLQRFAVLLSVEDLIKKLPNIITNNRYVIVDKKGPKIDRNALHETDTNTLEKAECVLQELKQLYREFPKEKCETNPCYLQNELKKLRAKRSEKLKRQLEELGVRADQQEIWEKDPDYKKDSVTFLQLKLCIILGRELNLKNKPVQLETRKVVFDGKEWKRVDNEVWVKEDTPTLLANLQRKVTDEIDKYVAEEINAAAKALWGKQQWTSWAQEKHTLSLDDSQHLWRSLRAKMQKKESIKKQSESKRNDSNDCCPSVDSDDCNCNAICKPVVGFCHFICGDSDDDSECCV